jgi:hypothetical protein
VSFAENADARGTLSSMDTWKLSVDAVLAAARTSRTAGVVRGGASDATEVSMAARDFGLAPDSAVYQRIERATALRLIAAVLHRDLAYRAEAMPRAAAESLAQRFVDALPEDAVFFANRGDASNSDSDPGDPDKSGWNPATLATFDTGVLAVTPTGSACIWFEDED